MPLILSQKFINIINALQIYQSAARAIPEEFKGPTYFSMWDEWLYNTEESESVCEICQGHNFELIYGNELRGIFPYWQIIDENTIYPSVYPNCRCRLTRTTFVTKNKNIEEI